MSYIYLGLPNPALLNPGIDLKLSNFKAFPLGGVRESYLVIGQEVNILGRQKQEVFFIWWNSVQRVWSGQAKRNPRHRTAFCKTWNRPLTQVRIESDTDKYLNYDHYVPAKPSSAYPSHRRWTEEETVWRTAKQPTWREFRGPVIAEYYSHSKCNQTLFFFNPKVNTG